MKTIQLLFLISFAGILTSCTENSQRVKEIEGTWYYNDKDKTGEFQEYFTIEYDHENVYQVQLIEHYLWKDKYKKKHKNLFGETRRQTDRHDTITMPLKYFSDTRTLGRVPEDYKFIFDKDFKTLKHDKRKLKKIK